MLLAGARLGAQTDFGPRASTSPTSGPTPTSTTMRLRLAVLLEGVDTYT